MKLDPYPWRDADDNHYLVYGPIDHPEMDGLVFAPQGDLGYSTTIEDYLTDEDAVAYRDRRVAR